MCVEGCCVWVWLERCRDGRYTVNASRCDVWVVCARLLVCIVACFVGFYQPEGAQRAKGWYLDCFTFSASVCLFVCLSVCLCVCTYHVRNILRHTLLCNCSV